MNKEAEEKVKKIADEKLEDVSGAGIKWPDNMPQPQYKPIDFEVKPVEGEKRPG